MRTIIAPCLLALLPLPLLAQPSAPGGSSRHVRDGRLAVTVTDRAEIRSARAGGRILSVCPKGEFLAVTGETAGEYAVLMQGDHTGYIAAAAVKLLDYRVGTDTPGPVSRLGLRLADTAKSYLGVPYRRGGHSESGMDSAALVRAVFRANGLSLPRSAYAQAGVGYGVPRQQRALWRAGDRLYFACRHWRADHAALYLGDGYFIHASVRHGRQVAIDSLEDAYYARRLIAVRRSAELVMDGG